MHSTLLRITLLATLPAALRANDVTFHRDVAGILQRNCQSCHRPGEAGPMSLLSYKEARPYAKAIKQAVVARKMVKTGDRIVLTAGVPVGNVGSTNLIKVHVVGRPIKPGTSSAKNR